MSTLLAELIIPFASTVIVVPSGLTRPAVEFVATPGREELVINPAPFVSSLVFVGTVMLIVFPELALVVNESTVVLFFWIVMVELFTVGITGLLLKSL